jgi:chemosensory pili system protein ChpA (sensor histidine kinase/response regulator)
MNDAEAFARFIYEMRTLLTAIESHCVALGGASGERRLQALRAVARLARSVAAPATAFAMDDLRALAEALAEAATRTAAASAEQRDDAERLAPLGARDTLSYMQWRVERLSATGFAVPPTARDLALVGQLERTLAPQPLEAPSADTPAAPSAPAADALAPSAPAADASAASAFTDDSELTLADLALVQSFANAPLRKRDPQADAQQIARIAQTPAFMTPAFMGQTQSGASFPVFGGMTEEEANTAPPEAKRAFVYETPDDLRALGQLVQAFEQQPEDPQTLNKMAMAAHKIKGAASQMRFISLSAIAELFQEVVSTARGTALSASPAFLPGLGRFLDLFEQGLAAAAQFDEPAPTLLDDARHLRDALLYPQTQRAPQSSALAQPTAQRGNLADHDLVLRIEASKLDMLMNQLGALAVNRGAVNHNRREIAHALAEVQVALERLREKSAQIADAHPLTYDHLASFAQPATLSHPLASLGAPDAMGAPAPAPPPTATGALRASWSNLQLEQYTEVDSEVDTALRALAEVVADVTANYGALSALLTQLGQITEAQEALTRGIQEDAMSIRLARLAEITPRLRITALVAAADLGKQLEFTAKGEAVEIDRLLLEELEQPLIQLVRNAVAHGVEGPEERLAQGKSAKGAVWIHAYNSGAEVVIEVGDDGRGVNVQELVDAAVAAERITREEGDRLSQEQALSLMFQLGFTTASSVGAMAGSGVGLADVAHTVHRLKGSITMRSDLGKGTTFQMRVPTSLSVAPVLEVNAAGQIFALPFALVEYTAIIEPARLRALVDAHAQAESGAPREWRMPVDTSWRPALNVLAADADTMPTPPSDMPAYALAETLGFEQDASALQRIVVIRLGEQLVGLLVESVGEGEAMRDATVRPLPRRLQRRVVRGAIVRPEDGQIALLIDPQEALAQRVAGNTLALRTVGPPAAPRAAPYALVVDDSVTIRRTLEQALTQAGFKTGQARDGREALEMMERALPRVLILDVEMPRLSGFQLLKIMRRSSVYQQVRVVMLTSRAADEHREYALAIGADAYLVKPCPQDILVETIRRLLTESEPV